jgi:hypothetical protein
MMDGYHLRRLRGLGLGSRQLAAPAHIIATHIIEAPWLVNGGHGASFMRHDEASSLRRRANTGPQEPQMMI